MCWAEKFCFCIPLNLGCVLLGASNFIIATAMAITSTVHFASGKRVELASVRNHTSSVFHMEITQESQDIILGILLAVALSWMLFSLILVLGIMRNNPSFILSYFFFGILLVIFGNLSALLLVLRSCLACAELGLALFLISMLYIHFLVAVYTVYELMQRGTDFRFHKTNNADDHLLNEEDFNYSTIESAID